MIEMRRADYQPTAPCEHASLLLDKGFKHWSDGEHNQDIVALHCEAAKIACPELYKQAYARWRNYQIGNGDNSGIWFGQLENRLYLGLGEFSPLEAGITLQRTYGVPFIPGSAIKGVLHHYAVEAKVEARIIDLLFGQEASTTDKSDSGAAAYVIFNDAWWIPQNRSALVPETVTVHHPDYYSSRGEKPATDFDSPNPNPQIAIQGSFLFSVEGEESLVKYTISLLKKALSERGIGAKSSSGYGYFSEDNAETKDFNLDKVLIPQKIKRQAEEKERRVEAAKEALVEAEKISQMTPFEQSIYQQIKDSSAPATGLLKRLEAKEWDGSEQAAVAGIVKALLQDASQWRPEFTGSNRSKLKQKTRSLKVLEFLKGENI